jgi:ankyrin repeat protein
MQVDAKGMDDDTPLHDAAMNGHEEVIEVLFHFNVDPVRHRGFADQRWRWGDGVCDWD